MLIKLNFHPSLHKMTGVKHHTFDVANLASIKDALIVLFPKLRSYIHLIMNRSLKENLCLVTMDGSTLNKHDYYISKIRHKELILSPIIEGSGGKIGAILGIVIGIALIATGVGIAMAPAASGIGTAGFGASALGGLTTAGGLVKMGISLALAAIMQMMMKPPAPPTTSTSSSRARRNNDMFDALENSTDTNTSVQLIYGEVRVSGQMVSGHVETITHGQADTIYVSDLFYKDVDELTKVEGIPA
jgi:predicted phage tail protein